MDKERIKELSQAIFELSYGSEQLDRDEVVEQMIAIHENVTELQHECGNSTKITLIGWRPTTAKAVAYSIKGGGETWRLRKDTNVRIAQQY